VTDVEKNQPRPSPNKRDRFSHVRGWLKRNKVFFETVAATSLTLASIAVAIVQAHIAIRQGTTAEQQNALLDKQNSLVDIQARVAEAQAMPAFDIKIQQELNPATGRADQNTLKIDNSGGPVREFTARAIYLIEITAGEKTIPYRKSVRLRIPINDYYAYSGITAASRGHLAGISGKDNNLAFITLSRALSAAAAGNNWLYANTEERTFLRIQYNDILNRPHDEYYEVAPVSGSWAISNDVGRVVFDEASPEKRVSLRDLTVDKVSRDISELIKASKP
jgi:hypothetical protein